jgi:hypothetical protein
MMGSSILARVADIPPAEHWAISWYRAGDQLIDLPMSHADFEHDAQYAARVLDAFGVAGAAHVIVNSLFTDAPWFAPFDLAIRRGGRTSPTEPWAFDAFRTATFARRFPVSAILSLTADVVTGLAGLGSLSDLLGDVPVIVARADACGPLVEAGLSPYRMFFVGPALAIERPDRCGAYVDGSAFEVTERDGEIYMSTRTGRAHQIKDLATGLRGHVITTPAAPHGSGEPGSADPRIILASTITP